MSKSNYTKYKDEIRDLRKLLNDDDYCAGLTKTFHSFLSDIHMRMVSNGRMSPKQIKAIRDGIDRWKLFYDENEVWKREKLLKKVMKLAELCEVHYFGNLQDKNFKLKVIYSIMEQIKTRGFVTKKQMLWCNETFKTIKKSKKNA